MEATVSYFLMLQKYINSNKKTEIKDCAQYLGNVSKDFTINNMKKKNRIKRICKIFSVNFNPIDTNDILGIHKYLVKRPWYKLF